MHFLIFLWCYLDPPKYIGHKKIIPLPYLFFFLKLKLRVEVRGLNFHPPLPSSVSRGPKGAQPLVYNTK